MPREHFLLVGRGFLKWFKYLCMFFMCAELCRDSARRGRLLTVFLTSMTVLSLNGLYQVFSPDHLDLIKQYSSDIPGRDIVIRMRSSLNAPNDLASFLLLAIPLAFYAWHQSRSSLRSFFLAALLALFSAAFVLTYSRAGFLALVMATALYLAVHKKLKFLVFTGGVLAALCLISETFRDNFLISLNLSDITVSQRLRYWLYTWEMIQAHPILGHGVNMYYQIIPAFTPAEETFRGYAHNAYLQMWGDVGIVGLTLFLIPIGYSVWREWLSRRERERKIDARSAVFVGLVAYLIQSFADTNFYALQTTFLFWIIWGYYWSLAEDEDASTSLRPNWTMSRAAAGRRMAS